MPTGVSMNPVISSSVSAWGYDADNQVLYIEYNSGRTYAYDAVPKEVADGLRTAPSTGRYVESYIKRGGFLFYEV